MDWGVFCSVMADDVLFWWFLGASDLLKGFESEEDASVPVLFKFFFILMLLFDAFVVGEVEKHVVVVVAKEALQMSNVQKIYRSQLRKEQYLIALTYQMNSNSKQTTTGNYAFKKAD